ncbi:Serine/threonine-protein kinase tel1 [Didymella pomorum]
MGATIQDAKRKQSTALGQISVLTTKVKIQCQAAKDRKEGFDELLPILKHHRGKPELQALGNKAYLALCDTLFQALRDERPKVFSSKAKDVFKTENSKNLQKCALATKLVIASGVRTIKSKTVEAIIETIIEVLPNRDPPRMKVLLSDLPKTLRLILDYHPHVERLPLDCWAAAVDFCIDSLVGSSIGAEDDTPSSLSTNVSSRGRTPFESVDASMARGSPRELVARTKSVTDEFSNSTEDFIHCLLSLVKASNAPVLGKAEAIMTALLYFLKRRSGRGSVAAAAMAGINAVLARTALQMLDLSKRIIKELLPLMNVMWTEQQLRDEILISLTYTEAHISSLVANVDDTTTCVDLEALLETMYADYRTRKETTMHQYLEEDHLCFRSMGAAAAHTHPCNTLAFSLDTEHVKSEGLWATVHAIARFSSMLDKRKRNIAHNREVYGENLSKRARIDLLFDEYVRHISEPRSNAKRAALQVVAFSAQEWPADEDKLQALMDKLLACMSEDNGTHSIWAMIALAA